MARLISDLLDYARTRAPGGLPVVLARADLHSICKDALEECRAAHPSTRIALETVGDAPFPAELARRMHLPPPTVTYLVKQLEAKGFLERRAEPGDLRKFRLVQTAAGREALGRGTEALGLVLGERLRRLDPKEVVVFDRIVRRLAGRNGGERQ